MNLHPESKPEVLTEPNFMDFSHISEFRKETETYIEKFKDNISQLGEKSSVHNVNLVMWMIQQGATKKEFLTLAKALEKAAGMVDALSVLEKRKSALEVAENEPGWFTLAFANLDRVVEDALQNIDTLD